MTLRKVSHDLRNFIDDTIPDLEIDAIQLLVSPNELSICYMKGYEMIQIHYSNSDTGCFVKCRGVNHLENVDSVTAFFIDFGLVLKHQKSILQRFILKIIKGTNAQVEESFIESLKIVVEKNQLKVKHIDIALPKQDQFFDLLKCFDAESLEKMELMDETYSFGILDLTDIVETEQWKKARALSIYYFAVHTDLEHFFSFATIHIILECIYSKNVISIKEHATQSDTFEAFFIQYKHYVNIFVECLGNPHLSELDKLTWYFKTNKKDKLLKIFQVPSMKRINFVLVDSSDVPPDVLVNL